MSSLEAIIHEGGRQFCVRTGSIIDIDRDGLAPGARLVFDDVRLLTGTSGTTVGRPTVPGARVHGTVQGAAHGKKLVIFKYRRRKDSKTRKGHRQHYTRVRITGVEAN